MYSEEVKVVLGFEPSGLLEKLIFAPGIGTPRTPLSSLLRDSEGESEFEVLGLFVVLGLLEVAGASVLGIFGILIFGSGNWAFAGRVKNKPSAKAAIRTSDDDLVISIFLLKVKFGEQGYKSLA